MGINLTNQNQQQQNPQFPNQAKMASNAQQQATKTHSRLRDSGVYHMMNATSTSRKGGNVFRGNSESMVKQAQHVEAINRQNNEDMRTHSLIG